MGNFLCRSDNDKTITRKDRDQDRGCDVAAYDFDAPNSFSKKDEDDDVLGNGTHQILNHSREENGNTDVEAKLRGFFGF